MKYKTVAELKTDISEMWGVPVEIKGRDSYGDDYCPECGEGGLLYRANRCTGQGLLWESLSIELPADAEHRDTREHHIHGHSRTCGLVLPRSRDGFKAGGRANV